MRLTRLGLLFVSLLLSSAESASTALNSNQHKFAGNLVSALYKDANECSSSLGVSMAFSLLYPSADTTNQIEMQAVFGYPSTETHRQLLWNSTQVGLNDRYNGKCTSASGNADEVQELQQACETEEATLKIVNRIWLTDFYIVSDEYYELLKSYMFQLDFHAGDAGKVINGWASDSTNGLIESIVEDGPLQGVELVAVNAIYLKAAWMHQFDKSMTNLDSFYSSPSRLTTLPSQVNFMHAVNYFQYSDTALPEFQILQLRFRGSISMIVALPATEAARPIDFQTIQPLLSGMERTKVAIALPKFRFESVYKENLKKSLQTIGLKSAFEGGLCFGGEGVCNAKVSQVIQKTVINVNEEGVEAASVTAAMVDRGAPVPDVPVLFLANYPFQFFIYESEEDVVLFEGRVGDPGSTYTVDEGPSLGSQHNDSSFWTESFNVDPRSPTDHSSTCLPWTWVASAMAVVGMTAMLF